MKEHDHSSCNKLRWSTIRGHADFDNAVHIETEEQTRVFGTNESTGPFVDTTDPINMKEQEQVLVPDECIRPEVDNTVAIDMKEQNHGSCNKLRGSPHCRYYFFYCDKRTKQRVFYRVKINGQTLIMLLLSTRKNKIAFLGQMKAASLL